MSPNNKVKIALVGCGRIAQTHLETINVLDEAVLVGVADINEEVSRSVGEQFGCRAYVGYKEMIDKEKPEVLCVATPPLLHPEISIHALQKGTHVLCEKPFAIDLESAKKMVKEAEEKSLFITMASKFRFVDDVIKAKGVIESGMLGEIILFELAFCAKVDMQNRWNSRKEISGGGVLIDNGTHAVDIVRYLLGPIKRIQALSGKQVQKMDVEDTAIVFFETATNARGCIELSWSIHKDSESFINIFGSGGMLSIGWKNSKYRQSEKEDWIVFGSGYDKKKAFINQYKDFINCIRRKTKPVINAEDSLESTRVIEITYKSLQGNNWLEV